jgi:hypothetical protein
MAKSGHRGRNLSRCSSVRSASRSFRTQAASGARVAPFGNLNPVEKSKIIPVSFSKAQLLNCITRTAFRAPVLPLAGDIIMRSPLMAQNSSSWSSVISTAGHMCSTSGSVGTVYVALSSARIIVLYCTITAYRFRAWNYSTICCGTTTNLFLRREFLFVCGTPIRQPPAAGLEVPVGYRRTFASATVRASLRRTGCGEGEPGRALWIGVRARRLGKVLLFPGA